jgi:3-deoxy-D-manno-octulosonic-acid transferase
VLRFIYSVLGYLLLPVVFLLLCIPKKGKKGYGRRITELFFPLAKFPDDGRSVVWFHTVSVGETVAAARLIRQFHEKYPDLRILVTTTTTTGAAEAVKIGDFVEHLFAPLDYPHAVSMFINRIRPEALIIMETELWPNWLAACSSAGIPVVLMNARMSERSCRRYGRIGGLFERYIGRHLSMVLCQNSEDGGRFSSLGVKDVRITGSLKCDIVPDPARIKEGVQLRSQLDRSKVWIAASTHEGEDEVYLNVHRRLLKDYPGALLMLAARHPERFEQVCRLAAAEGFRTSRLSDMSSFTADTEVLICDAMGQMIKLFEASDLAVMGGSFTDVGGHNPLEPASLGKAVLMGPYFYNFKEFTLKMRDAGGLLVTQNEEELLSALRSLLADPKKRRIMGEAALGVMIRGQGATERTLDHISEIICRSS